LSRARPNDVGIERSGRTEHTDFGGARSEPLIPPSRPAFVNRVAAVPPAKSPAAPLIPPTPSPQTPSSPASSNPIPAPETITPHVTFGTRSSFPARQSNHAPPLIKPGVAPKRTENYPDELSKIKGIGDVYKKRLYAAGIYTWHQIAETDLETLRTATNAYPSSNVEEWPVQARQLAEKHGRKNALYTGPSPDDLTSILGIGPISAQSLYRVGICTFEQLAETPVESLAALFPIAVAGDQPDFIGWVQKAQELAERKGL
jgi:predicted flap endonuclease-1-like 5' DNA nuclease